MTEQTNTSKYAETREVEKAIHALQSGDFLSLHAAARRLLLGLPSDLADDLMQEALMRALQGKRRWPRMVDFVTFLRGTMRSIANHWRNSPSTEDLPEIKSSGPGPETQAIAKDKIEKIRSLFADDPIALEVLSGWEMELTGPDIKELAGISEKELRATNRRIRYKLANNEDLSRV